MFEIAKTQLLDAYHNVLFEILLDELEERRQQFVAQFPPEKLRELKDRALLTFVHGEQPRQGLFYQLEFGALGAGLGNVWGGSSLKFKVYRAENGEWHRKGKGNAPLPCSESEAITITEAMMHQLSSAVKWAYEMHLESGDGGIWRKFEENLQLNAANVLPDDEGYNAPIAMLGWAHKYLALVFPNLFSFHHKADTLAYHLMRLGIQPLETRYMLDWQWRQLRLGDDQLRECNPIALMHAAYSENAFSSGVRYWRIGTQEGEEQIDRWPNMSDGGFASIGWGKLGNLNVALEGLGEKEARQQLIKMLEAQYTDKERTPQTLGNWASQIYAFYAKMQPDDRIVAMRGQTLLGVGIVDSSYSFHGDDLQPHHRQVQWFDVPAEKWEDAPGLRTTVYDFSDQYSRALHIEGIIASEPPFILPLPVLEPTDLKEEPPLPSLIPLTKMEERIHSVLERKGQAILYGPPGTGKTYHARRTARELLARQVFGKTWAQLTSESEQNRVDERIIFCTFHPSYTYEEFVEGYRPVITDNGPSFKRQDGLFVEVCEKARGQEGHHVLIIDEINRGSVAAVLGELLTLLEADKREALSVRLPLSRRDFTVPRNLWIIGTMNTADRSISLLDAALRRRFGFVELMPEPKHLDTQIGDLSLASLLRVLNQRVRENVSRNARELQVGHAYFLHNGRPIETKRQLQYVMRDDVIPLLSEYCFESLDTLQRILGETLVNTQGEGIRSGIVNNEEHFYSALCELVGLATQSDTAVIAAEIEGIQSANDAGVDEENAEFATDGDRR